MKNRFGILFTTLLLVMHSAFSQDASISGRVLRRGYYPVDNARVVYRHAATGLEFQTVTDDSGIYHFSNLPLSAGDRPAISGSRFAVVTNSGGSSHLIWYAQNSPIRAVRIYDILGRKVRNLRLTSRSVESSWQNYGLWNGVNDDGFSVSSGIYFVVPETPESNSALRILHVRGGSSDAVSPRTLRIVNPRSDHEIRLRDDGTLDETEYQVRIESGVDGDRFLPREFLRDLHDGNNGWVTDTVLWETPRRVLFIGNSYTYFNGGLDSHVEAMIRDAHPGMGFSADQIACGGCTLENHWNSAATCSLIAQGNYDMVVLQEQSTRPIDNPEFMFRYAVLLDSLVRLSGAETAFFMTWAREYDQTMIDGLAASYNQIGDSLHALVIPVGRAWHQCVADSADFSLYIEDGSHPNMHGTYLAACTFYAALLGESPLGVSYVCDSTITPTDRDYLQNLSWNIIREFGP